MAFQAAHFLFITLSFVLAARAATYSLTDNWVGTAFLQAFSWQAIADPTNGRVNYLSQADSVAQNLTYTTSNRLVLKADSTTVLSASGPGRKSNRIQSNKQFGQNTVLVADVNHMPAGCGSWPSLWSTDVPSWPRLGEIDIIEGVNDVSPNTISLHTTATCTIPSTLAGASGRVTNTDCNWQANGNTGCSFVASNSKSYGPSFNSAGGGWYALERTPQFIKVWFWSRQDGAPTDVKTLGQSQVDTSTWGTPVAWFTNSGCDIPSHFGAHNIIINLTFCGDWAGSVYSQNGCPGTCVDYVNNNPSAFTNAYWDINAIRMYGA